MNYYRRYVGDYLRDTSRLSMLEHGAYTLMLDYYYADERPLPLDKDELYLMVRAMRPDDRRAVDKILATFFKREPDGYHQKRVDHEISVSKQARANGKGGGRPPTGVQTETETGLVTGSETGEVTETITGSGHPPSTNLQPLPTNPQKSTASAASERISLSAGFEWQGITEERKSLWAKAYPAVSLESELAAAAVWAMENPANCKSNWGRFIAAWLKRAQDRAPRVNGKAKPDYARAVADLPGD